MNCERDLVNSNRHTVYCIDFPYNKKEYNLMMADIDAETCSYLQLFNPLKPELNPICYLLALLGAHHFLHVSRIRVKLLTFRLLMS